MIAVFGSINVDLVARAHAHPRPGETVSGSDYRLFPGGKGANQALAASRAGAAVRFVGAVGRDAFAETALAALREGGVDLACVVRRGEKTGLGLIVVDAAGENTIVVAPGANRTLTASDADAIAFAAGDTLLLQLEVPYGESREVARRAKEAGGRTILSVAPFRPISVEDAGPASILVMNEGESAALSAHLGLKPGGEEENVTGLARLFGRIVIATLGARGAVAVSDGSIVRVAALPVAPVDTTGAGDTFAGVLAALLDEGAGLESAMRHAAVAASLSTTREGAQPSFPMRAEIDSALARMGAR